ncbi:MAG TPA: hypothetical protein VLJ83_10300 [Gemmatimonadaceae bacterium]|nr:hypothetical protein [Gemmatimonadaceae bacterium]
MTEDNFEKFLKQTAQDYNAPPARVPREEMWSAIQAKRAAGPQVVYGGGLASSGAPARRFGTRVWLGAAAAAMLLVATGVGIGRWTAAPARPAQSSLPVSPVVVTPADSQSPGASPTESNRVAAATPVGRGSNRVATTGSRTQSRSSVSQGGASDVATGPTAQPSASSSAYQLTTVRHLSEAEALLTSFRARTTADQQMDAQLGAWARQLLSNTRLLLDSPVANDPQRRPLLQDLELVLVQIVQLSPGTAPQDRELIEKTLQQEHVLTRLRTAIPAGSQRGS